MIDDPTSTPAVRVILAGLDGVAQTRLMQAIAHLHAHPVIVRDDPLTLDAVCRGPMADLLVVGHDPPAVDALQVLRVTRFAAPRLPVLVYATRSSERLAVEALRGGASGFVPSRADPDALEAAVREALDGMVGRPVVRQDRRLDAMLDALGIGTFRADPGGRVVAISQTMRRILREPSAVSQAETGPGAVSLSGMLAMCRSGIAEQAVQRKSWALVAADGSTINVEGDVRAVCDERGRLVGFEGYLRDVTARERDREEAEYRAMLLDQVQHAVIGADDRLAITLWNRGAERLFGWTAAEVVGKDVATLSGGARQLALRSSVETALKSVGVWNGEFPCVCADGLARDVYCRATRLRLGDDTTEYVGMLVDITARKQLEARLRDTVADREHVLSEARRRVKSNLQLVSSLISIQLSRHADLPLRQFAQEAQNRIRAIALLHEWLLRSPEAASISMQCYLSQVTRYLSMTYADQSVAQVVCEAEAIPLGVETATRIGLIVNELVVNALKYAFVGRSDGTVSVTFVRGPARTALLEVRDSGVGLPAATDPARVRSLGLRLVSDLAAGIGASMRIERDGGTAFCFSLPLGD